MSDDWTDEQIKTAVGMKRAGIKLSDIAKRIGRTKGAVQAKMKKAGFVFHGRGKKRNMYSRITADNVLNKRDEL